MPCWRTEDKDPLLNQEDLCFPSALASILQEHYVHPSVCCTVFVPGPSRLDLVNLTKVVVQCHVCLGFILSRAHSKQISRRWHVKLAPVNSFNIVKVVPQLPDIFLYLFPLICTDFVKATKLYFKVNH